MNHLDFIFCSVVIIYPTLEIMIVLILCHIYKKIYISYSQTTFQQSETLVLVDSGQLFSPPQDKTETYMPKISHTPNSQRTVNSKWFFGGTVVGSKGTQRMHTNTERTCKLQTERTCRGINSGLSAQNC